MHDRLTRRSLGVAATVAAVALMSLIPSAADARGLPSANIDGKTRCRTNVKMQGKRYRAVCVRFYKADNCPGRDLSVVVRANGGVQVIATDSIGRGEGTVIPFITIGRRPRVIHVPVAGGKSRFVYVGYTGTIRRRMSVTCSGRP